MQLYIALYSEERCSSVVNTTRKTKDVVRAKFTGCLYGCELQLVKFSTASVLLIEITPQKACLK